MILGLLLLVLGCSPPDEPLPTPVLPGTSSGAQRGVGPATAAGVINVPPVDPGVLAPGELLEVASRSGLGQAVSDAVPRRLFAPSASDPAMAAVRTGVVLADAVASAGSTNAHDLLERVRAIEAGLLAMEADEERKGQAGALRAELERSGLVPGSASAALNKIVARPPPTGAADPLVLHTRLMQAGAWIATMDTLAVALQASGHPELAPPILGRSAEASYFLAWTRRATLGRPGDDPLKGVEGHLAALSQLPAASATPSAVRAHTEPVLVDL